MRAIDLILQQERLVTFEMMIQALRRGLPAVFLAFVALPLALLSAGPAAAQEKTYTIGCSLPLSGPLVGIGQPVKAGIEIAMEEENAALKARGIAFKLECFDSKGDPKETINIAQRLIDQPDVIVSLSDFSSTCSMAAAETYNAGKLVQLSPTTSHPDFVKMNPWMFRTSITIPMFVRATADEAIDKFKLKRAVVVQVQTDFGASVGSNFVDQFKSRSGEILDQFIYNPGQTDFRSILTQIRRLDPDTIFLAMLEEEAVNFNKQRQQFGLKQMVFDSTVGVTPRALELGGPAMNGIVAMTMFSEQIDNPVAKDFAKRYREHTGGQSPDLWGAYGYDAARVAIDAAVRAYPNLTRTSERDQIALTKDYLGANGPLSIDPQTHEVIRQPPPFVQITDGKPLLVR